MWVDIKTLLKQWLNSFTLTHILYYVKSKSFIFLHGLDMQSTIFCDFPSNSLVSAKRIMYLQHNEVIN